MSDIETIKARIRKLMAVAGDGIATDGEIDNAMRLAGKLLDAHHLVDADIDTQADADDLTMGESFATSQRTQFSTWESALGNAVIKLFGCVSWYISHDTAPIRVNGVALMDGNETRKGRRICFYGPVVESREAAELFEEWARSIATMGVARWGGCFRGDGAMYCYGFASELYRKAKAIDAERALVQAKPIPSLSTPASADCTAITLSGRYELLKTAGKAWLEKERGIKKLSKASRGGGYSAGSSGALSEGRKHGAAANFSRSKRRRQLPG